MFGDLSEMLPLQYLQLSVTSRLVIDSRLLVYAKNIACIQNHVLEEIWDYMCHYQLKSPLNNIELTLSHIVLNRCPARQVMVGIYGLCAVWGEPLAQTAQSFMPPLMYGSQKNLKQVNPCHFNFCVTDRPGSIGCPSHFPCNSSLSLR